MQSGKPQFGYIYGVGVLGSLSIYTLLNLMSEKSIDAYRVVSVLGYCLLPMVAVGALSVVVTLEYVSFLLVVVRGLVANIDVTETSPSQRHSGLHALHTIHSVVHIRSIGHLCGRVAHVRTAPTARIPHWTPIRLLRTA